MISSYFAAVAILLTGQCPSGQCVRPTAIVQPHVYQASDSSGQAWQHADPVWLQTWIASHNAQLAKDVTVKPKPSPQVATLPPQAMAHTDAYGFTAWLNGQRAAHGLHAVVHDPSLSAWAASNNGQQHTRGMGHHTMGSARRQNSGMGSGSVVWPAWMASGAHRSALLDPTITRIGIAFSGSYWTFNAH